MKENTLFLQEKPPYMYKVTSQRSAVAACMLVVVITFLVFLGGAILWGHPLLYTALPVLFLLAGACYAYILKNKLSDWRAAERWVLSTGLCVAVLALLACAILWDQQLSLQTVFASAGAFLLPFTVTELWAVYTEISFGDIRTWQLTNEGTDDLPASYLHGIPVRFRVIQEPEVSGAGRLPVLASGRLKLCDVFYGMVQKQNQKGQHPIALKSREQEPHTWIFYTTDMWLWYRTLDPEKTLLDNQIKKNTVIYAQRVSKEAFAMPLKEEHQKIAR